MVASVTPNSSPQNKDQISGTLGSAWPLDKYAARFCCLSVQSSSWIAHHVVTQSHQEDTALPLDASPRGGVGGQPQKKKIGCALQQSGVAATHPRYDDESKRKFSLRHILMHLYPRHAVLPSLHLEQPQQEIAGQHVHSNLVAVPHQSAEEPASNLMGFSMSS